MMCTEMNQSKAEGNKNRHKEDGKKNLKGRSRQSLKQTK
jgi:hypothetical protein